MKEISTSIGQPYENLNGDLQCDAVGHLGDYVIRKMPDHTWIAIQLFGAIGSIAATAPTPEDAFNQAEAWHYAHGAQKRLMMSLAIEGVEAFDLELALNEVLKLVSEGYTSGFDRNETGSYKFSIDAIN
ncbi:MULTISPECIES: hypothetical protein [unclassified Methylobacter]|jgi:hypothetical protein|uniref:hypothetical protein n=1 Tax=unclassified Methylobacter TaxID=2635283 RepID=UPI0018948452|nr:MULTISPECIES: hypothetical protein [unclassified Methylobacter]MBF6650004.1 hypothetical protein [Methylobacter sp. BlB1]WAK04397.1 hypothetical protein LZ558_22290 [Methylobacter sp. YRD-M1]